MCVYACVWLCIPKVYFGDKILIIQDHNDALICLFPLHLSY